MRAMTRRGLWVVAGIAFLLPAEDAAGEPLIDENTCDEICTWSSDCAEPCTEGGDEVTCGGFGICDDSGSSSGGGCVADTCDLGACTRPLGGDGDCDGVPDPLEYDLAHRFFPDLRVQPSDVDEVYLWRGWAIPYTVQALAPRSGNVCSETYECLEIRYGTAYVEDTGSFGHLGDSEFYAALVRRTTGWTSASTDAGAWEMIRDFTAAHWRATGDSSRFGGYGECLPACSDWNDSESACRTFSHCIWFEGRCIGDSVCSTHSPESCWMVQGCYWDDFYQRCFDSFFGGTCGHNQYSCSVQANYGSCQYYPSSCVTQIPCYRSSPMTGPRTVYAAEGKHGLYHSVGACNSGGFLGFDSCPDSNPAYSMRSDIAGRLQNVGWEDSNCVYRDVYMQHPDGCQLYNVWGGLGFADSSSYESHFRYLLNWWLP